MVDVRCIGDCQNCHLPVCVEAEDRIVLDEVSRKPEITVREWKPTRTQHPVSRQKAVNRWSM